MDISALGLQYFDAVYKPETCKQGQNTREEVVYPHGQSFGGSVRAVANVCIALGFTVCNTFYFQALLTETLHLEFSLEAALDCGYVCL